MHSCIVGSDGESLAGGPLIRPGLRGVRLNPFGLTWEDFEAWVNARAERHPEEFPELEDDTSSPTDTQED